MKVLVINNMAPFVWGGAEELAENLKQNLIIHGHEAEILRIPFKYEPANDIISQMMMVRAFELTNVDHVIALKFPVYLIRHPKKTIWLLHQYRQAYDLFDVGLSNIPNSDNGLKLKKSIKNADNEAFIESRAIYTNSKVTQDRLFKYNNIKSTVLLPPVNNPEIFTGGIMDDYIFAGGRINGMKRQCLLLEALSKTKKRVKMIIAGPPDSDADRNTLILLLEKLNLKDRVKLDLRFLPRQEYANYLNKSLASIYIPLDEDSLGYVMMESATAGKALLTTSDSGGLLHLVKHKETGLISEPNAESIAEILDVIWEDKKKALLYGEQAREYWNSLNITWNNVIKVLVK